ncbi:unnamed protein product [Arctogadus glacialis]
MDHSGLLCSTTPSPSWNGPKGSTFSPSAWNEVYSYSVNKGPAVPPKQHSAGGHAHARGPGPHCGSFTPDPSGGWKRRRAHPPRGGVAMTTGIHDDGSGAETRGRGGPRPGQPREDGAGRHDGGRGRERSARSVAAANAFKFREPLPLHAQRRRRRPLRPAGPPTPGPVRRRATAHPHGGRPPTSTPPTTSINPTSRTSRARATSTTTTRARGESYALCTPAPAPRTVAALADSASVAASDYSGGEGRLRLRSRSISLKKSKRKPPPPVRSVSLMKNLGEAEGPPRGRGEADHRLGGKRAPQPGDPGARQAGGAELNFPGHWQLGDWKTTPTGLCLAPALPPAPHGHRVHEGAGQLRVPPGLPSVSRDSSPSQFSPGDGHQGLLPLQPPGLMSPPPAATPANRRRPRPPSRPITGRRLGSHGTLGCKMRPKIPERKSSLPSPKDPMAAVPLSFEMPVNAHLDLTSLRPKTRASRRHSRHVRRPVKPGKGGPGRPPAPRGARGGGGRGLGHAVTGTSRRSPARSVSRSVTVDDCHRRRRRTPSRRRPRPGPPTATPAPAAAPTRSPSPSVAVKPPLPKRAAYSCSMRLARLGLHLAPRAPRLPAPAPPSERPVPLGTSTSGSEVPELRTRATRCQCTHHRVPMPGRALEKKKPKVPPPVPKKPSVLLLQAAVPPASNGAPLKRARGRSHDAAGLLPSRRAARPDDLPISPSPFGLLRIFPSLPEMEEPRGEVEEVGGEMSEMQEEERGCVAHEEESSKGVVLHVVLAA